MERKKGKEIVWFGFYLIIFVLAPLNLSDLVCLILLIFVLSCETSGTNKAKQQRSTRLRSIDWLGAPRDTNR